MDASHESPPVEHNQDVLAKQAAQEIISKIRAIDAKGTQDQQQQQKSDLAAETIREYLQSKNNLEKLKESEKLGGDTEEVKDKIKREEQKIGMSLVKACTLADNDIQVVKNLKANRILRQLSNTSLTDSEAMTIQNSVGDYLLGNKVDDIIISKPGATRSGFIEGIANLINEDGLAAQKLITTLILRASDFGMQPAEMQERLARNFIPEPQPDEEIPFDQQGRESNTSFTGNKKIDAEMLEAGLGNDMHYYRVKFTPDQLKLIQTFYSPTAFAEYVEQLGNRASDGSTDPSKVLQEKMQIKEHVKHHFEKNPESLKGRSMEEAVEEEAERHWGEIVSSRMRDEVSDIVNHLFLTLQLKAPHKFYREILQEADPFYGPAPTLNKIQTAIAKLMTTTAAMEKSGDIENPLLKKMGALQLYRHQERDSYIDERDKKLYPRMKPLPIGTRISTSKFLEGLNMLIDHTTHKDELFQNGRALYNHPAGEKGFYAHLGEFVDGSLKGIDIDEILMLPDGQYILEAYQLYEKYLKADYAALDWRQRPDQYQPQLEEVNSKLELELIKVLQEYYPDMTEMKIRSIANSAVGISRTMTLSEPETSSYADPVDADGNGMIASYSTNDASSLNVFNTFNNSLRWQGDFNWNLMYFMPVEGRRGMWEHKESKDNQAKFMNSFKVEVGRGKLPKLFADALVDINKVGGPQGKRKGWRNKYSFDGHFIYNPGGNKINVFETFKAMEAIGYEGVSDFIETKKAEAALLKATDGELAEDRKNFFRYVYKNYIYEGDDPKNFQESDLDNYLAKLRVVGEERALKHIKGELPGVRGKGSAIIDGSWEEQVTYATSQLFMESLLAHYTAARMPTLLLKIGRNRFTENGISRREQTFRNLRDSKHWTREQFDQTMKDFGVVEMLFRKQISGKIREEMSFDEDFMLNQTDKIDGFKNEDGFSFRLDDVKIRNLLSKNSKGIRFKSVDEVERVVELWKYMRDDYFKNADDGMSYLDEKAFKEIKDYPFTIGLEDTDMSLVAYRGTGPRMVARAVKDVAAIEKTITPWLMQMPNLMLEVAVNGKYDISPLIEFLRKAQQEIIGVHGDEAAQEFVYTMSSAIINYFKRDGMAKPLFGLFRFGQINSNAAEYTGDSNATWEWEAREIDQWCIALQSYRLLPKKPYKLDKTENGVHTGGKLEDVWWINPITKKPFKTIFKKKHVDFEYNIARLRKEHGADFGAISWDYINKYLPIFLIALMAKYIKDAIEEMMGKKK